MIGRVCGPMTRSMPSLIPGLPARPIPAIRPSLIPISALTTPIVGSTTTAPTTTASSSRRTARARLGHAESHSFAYPQIGRRRSPGDHLPPRSRVRVPERMRSPSCGRTSLVARQGRDDSRLRASRRRVGDAAEPDEPNRCAAHRGPSAPTTASRSDGSRAPRGGRTPAGRSPDQRKVRGDTDDAARGVRDGELEAFPSVRATAIGRGRGGHDRAGAQLSTGCVRSKRIDERDQPRPVLEQDLEVARCAGNLSKHETHNPSCCPNRSFPHPVQSLGKNKLARHPNRCCNNILSS